MSIASKRVLEQPCELRITIRNVNVRAKGATLAWIAESRNNIPESEQTPVNGNALLDTLALGCGSFKLRSHVSWKQ